MSSSPTLVTWQPEPEGKSCSWVVRVECALRNTQGLCLRTSSPFPFTAHPPCPDRSQLLQHRSAEVLSSLGGATVRREAGGGNPTTRRRSAQGKFQSSSSPEAPPSFGCTRLGFCVGGPAGSWRRWARAEGKGHSRSKAGVLIGWHILLSFLLPTAVQLWDPNLLRLQGCDSSLGHRGLRRWMGNFFSFLFLIFNFHWSVGGLPCCWVVWGFCFPSWTTT